MHRPLVFVCGVVSYALLIVTPTHVFAQDHSHAGITADRHSNSALVQAVREATERFKDVQAATDAEYQLLFGCVSGPDYGAMGLHYVNLGLVFDGGELDPAHPEIILYEPLPNGRLRITGADFLVIAKDWDEKHPGDPPQLMGQLFHRFEAPNRFGSLTSIRCTCGHGRTARPGRSRTGTPTCHATASPRSKRSGAERPDDSRSSCRSRGPGRGVRLRPGST